MGDDDSLEDEGLGEGPDSRLAALYRVPIARTQTAMATWVGDVRPQRRHIRADLVAGLPGAISSVPDGMAASVLAGVNPAHGLYASFAGPVTGGLSSSTRLMVITTTSAAALAAGSAIAPFHGDERSDAMLWLTLMAGGVMIAAAVLNLSRYIRFVSYSVMLGFLTGIAVNMVLGQLPDLLGVSAEGSVAATKAVYVVTHLGEVEPASAVAGAVALLALIALARTKVAAVSSLVALAVPTVGILVLSATGVALVKDNGAIPQGLPLPQIPDPSAFHFSLITGALSVAALVLVQGAGVAEAVPNPGGTPSSTRRDFTAQGLANAASGLFGGQPVGGSVGQTALNVTAGARTRWAGIWSGLWMGAILLIFAGLVGQVAMPTLAAVLIYAGWGSIHPREVVAVARAGTIPAVAMLATFCAVLVLPVATAVGVGVIASLLLQLNQESLDLRLVRLTRDSDGRMMETTVPESAGPGDVVVLNLYGSLFYAGARTLQRRLPGPAPRDPGGSATGDQRPGPTVVLRLRGRTTLGATFLRVVSDYARTLEDAHGELYLSGVDPQLVEKWRRDGVTHQLGGVRIYAATSVLGESTQAATAAAGSRTAEVVHRVAVVSSGSRESVLGDRDDLDDGDPE